MFFSAISIPIFLTFYNMDLTYVLLISLSSSKILSLPPLHENLPIKFIRTGFQLYLVQCSVFTVTTSLILCTNMLQSVHAIVSYMLSYSKTVDLKIVKLYKEFYIAVELMNSLHRILTGVFLFVAFFVLLLSINLTFLGWNVLPANVYFIAPLITVILVVFVMVLFNVDGFVFEATGKITFRWRGSSNQSLYMRKVLKSLRCASIPVGDIGIVDRSIKMNYMQALINYAVDLLILINM